MRHKLSVPWTSRLPVTRWLTRHNSPFSAYAANHDVQREDGLDHLAALHGSGLQTEKH